MKTKEVVIWIIVIIVLIAGLWLLVRAVNNSPSPSTLLQIKIPAISKNDFTQGNPNAKVTLVEYSDFQCPACKAFFPVINQLEKEFGDKLLVVYRFFPLVNTHQNSMSSTQAAYAAFLQGKFWEMLGLLYENQDKWSNSNNAKEIFIGYAKDLGLDLSKFESDMDNSSTIKFITDALNNATTLGLNSTPSFFINGNYIQNPRSYEDFKKLIQDELSK